MSTGLPYPSPVLWRYGDILNVDGAEEAQHMTFNRQREVYGINPYGAYIFFDPEDFWPMMPRQPIHAIMQGWTWYDFGGTPRPRFWFLAGYYLDHYARPLSLWWVCDHVSTYAIAW